MTLIGVYGFHCVVFSVVFYSAFGTVGGVNSWSSVMLCSRRIGLTILCVISCILLSELHYAQGEFWCTRVKWSGYIFEVNRASITCTETV